METVRFIIYRKAAFAGALLPYNICINGQFFGTLKNGKMLKVNVPKADVYFLEDSNSFERNAVIYGNDFSEYNILLKRAGGWRTDSYNEFYIDHGGRISRLPSFHFEKFISATFEDSNEEFSADECLLIRCMEFALGITDDVQEVLASDYLTEIIDALQKIGATHYANLLLQIINEFFSDVVLPLSDKQLDQMYDRMNKANKLIWNNENLAWDELHRVVVRHITSKLNSKENVY